VNVVNSQPLRAVVWCAVSTKAQAEEDKTSLLTQEREAREFCASNGWTIADVLVVPGHSRYIVDFYELAEKASDGGCDAFWRLRDHWKAKDFDILIARDADRFAREQAPIALIISSIIQAGARIYTFTDGWIDKTDYRFKGTMIGYRAASEVDNLMKKAAAAKDQLAKTGIYYNARPAWSHKVVRDELGKALSIVPDEEKQFIIENAARIVIEGFGWFHIKNSIADMAF
jgi:DNA invertase Pin-like site-specific DNA recombinase